MKTIETINKVCIYEENGVECKGLRSDRPHLIVTEHWNRREFIVLVYDGEKITIAAEDLRKAIDNAQNAHTY